MRGEDIRKLVVVKMEEHTPFGPDSGEVLLAGGDILDEVKPIYSYIDASIEEAANEMLLLCPIGRLTSVAVDAVSVCEPNAEPQDAAIGWIEKPQDWLRLHTLQMSGWQRPVHEVVRPENPVYLLQFNRWTRGTAQKPVVTDDGARLHYYSQPRLAEPTILTLLYIKRYDDETDYATEVGELIALNTARKVYDIFGNTEQAGVMQKEIESVMSIATN